MQPSLLTPLLDRLLDPVGDALNPEAARRLLDIRADRKTQAVVDRLAAKCNEGRLSEAEAPSTKVMSSPAAFWPFFGSRRGPRWRVARSGDVRRVKPERPLDCSGRLDSRAFMR